MGQHKKRHNILIISAANLCEENERESCVFDERSLENFFRDPCRLVGQQGSYGLQQVVRIAE